MLPVCDVKSTLFAVSFPAVEVIEPAASKLIALEVAVPRFPPNVMAPFTDVNATAPPLMAPVVVSPPRAFTWKRSPFEPLDDAPILLAPVPTLLKVTLELVFALTVLPCTSYETEITPLVDLRVRSFPD